GSLSTLQFSYEEEVIDKCPPGQETLDPLESFNEVIFEPSIAMAILRLVHAAMLALTNKMASFKCTHAVVCRLPNSWRPRDGKEGSLDRARRQHEEYVKALRSVGLDVLEMPADELIPSCPYVEDCAIVCNGAALIAKPAAASRKRETEAIRAVLKKELNLYIMEVTDPNATLDGGDVLFTGREFFVGLSTNTNEGGAAAVASAFPEFPCTPIKLGDNCHLKNLISMAGPDVISVGSGESAQKLLKRIEREATFQYQKLTVSDDIAANVLYVNNVLLHRAKEEFPDSVKILEDRILYPRYALEFSELGSLSSCCLLIKKTKHMKNL
ncbi:unnamed protein product, partial [Darwinula stevensoni]